MARRLPLDEIDSKVVLTTYAGVVGAAGLFVTGWATLWIHDPFLGNLWGWHSVVRVCGTVVMAAAACAFGSSRIKDPVDRRRALTWFVIAHGLVLGMSGLQAWAVWGDGLPSIGRTALLALTFVSVILFVAWTRQGGDVVPLGEYLGWFGERPRPVALLRSLYEDQLRLAGARDERQRFARDLHDSVKQQIFAIQAAAATAEVRLPADTAGVSDAVGRIRVAARDAMAELDAMLDQLRAVPTENVGLSDALRKQAEACGIRTGAVVTFESGPLPPSAVWPPGAHEGLFRAAQEALANVARHARASHVAVQLHAPDNIILEITDDGLGFDPSKAGSGMGLDNIRSRAAEIGAAVNLTSATGRGTHLSIVVPYERLAARPFVWRAVRRSVVAAAFVVLFERARPTPLRMGFLIFGSVAVLDALRYAAAGLKARRLKRRP